jgi:hypothetical protein
MHVTALTSKKIATAVRWSARVLSVLLFLFWGAFFVEHLAWFADPHGWPPVGVISVQFAHLVLLIGLAMAWKWELLGSILILVSSLVFFSQTAGKNFPLFFAVTSLPAVLWLFCYLQSKRTN